jgi:uncharacterized protein
MAVKANGAIALLVETPGLSPIKPLLATSIGQENCLEFYQQSLAVTTSTIQYANQELAGLGHPELDIFWAPVETDPSVATMWTDFPVIPQGEGPQGSKLHHVYSTLLSGYAFAMLGYVDSPHIPPSVYTKIASSFYQEAKSKDYIVGPGEFGGFFVFCGRKEIPLSIWSQVPYENQQALNFFISAISNLGSVSYIEMQPSVETIKDITRLKSMFSQAPNLTPEQMELRSWLNRHLK